MAEYDDSATRDGVDDAPRRRRGQQGRALALMLAWSAHAPRRVGETLRVSGEAAICLGRGASGATGSEVAGVFERQRPGRNESVGPLKDPTISRRHLRIESAGDRLEVEQIGRGTVYLNGQPAERFAAYPGDVIAIGSRALFLVTKRPRLLTGAPSWPESMQREFGLADDLGLVGESPLMWELRDQLAFIARRDQHVLVLGSSGVGKELVTRAIHALSPRAGAPLIVRNAATIPEGIADAELFGNVRNYPNVGMPSRPGLIGSADGGTLFLDELGELPEQLQAHLLRILDGSGDFQRLGESRSRTSNMRVLAATNRGIEELRHDLAPRFTARLMVPDLNARADDIPLLIGHLLARMVDEDPELASRFSRPHGEALSAVDPVLITALLRHPWTLHVRELNSLLFTALSQSPGTTVELPEGLIATAPSAPPEPPAPSRRVTAAMVRDSLARHEGVKAKVWRELGLDNRYQLRRLIRKFGIEEGPAGDAGLAP